MTTQSKKKFKYDFTTVPIEDTNNIRFNPFNGDIVGVGGCTNTPRNFCVWDGNTHELKYHFVDQDKVGNAFMYLAFSIDGKYMAAIGSCNGYHLHIWDAHTYEHIKAINLLADLLPRNEDGTLDTDEPNYRKDGLMTYQPIFCSVPGHEHDIVVPCSDWHYRLYKIDQDELITMFCFRNVKGGFKSATFFAFVESESVPGAYDHLLGNGLNLEWRSSSFKEKRTIHLPSECGIYEHCYIEKRRQIFSIITNSKLKNEWGTILLTDDRLRSDPERIQIKIQLPVTVIAYSSHDDVVAIGLNNRSIVFFDIKTRSICGRICAKDVPPYFLLHSLAFKQNESRLATLDRYHTETIRDISYEIVRQ